MPGKRTAPEEPDVARSSPKRARCALPSSLASHSLQQIHCEAVSPLLPPEAEAVDEELFRFSIDTQLEPPETAGSPRFRASSTPPANDRVTEAPSIARASLTSENLELWDTLHPPMAQYTAVSEASLSAEPAEDIDKRQAAYGIYIHRGDIPETLRKHIDDVIMDMQKPTTPSAARLARNSTRARGMNEPQGRELLGRDLLFKTEIDDGEELIQVLPEVIFARHWLPVAPEKRVERQYGALEQPRPDHAVGYITQQDARSMKPRSKPAFDRYALTTQMHFPFLTCQWKSQKSGEGHYHASLQGARDGAAIVRDLHDFYRAAQHTPSIVDTAHFSLTTDTDSAKLWVHWLETKEDGGAAYHMELISQAFLRPLTSKDTAMVDMRKMLRNILEYAVSARLNNIKAAIPNLPLPPPLTRSPKRGQPKKLMSSSDTVTNPAARVGRPLATAPRFDAPLPAPEPWSSPLKRQREEY